MLIEVRPKADERHILLSLKSTSLSLSLNQAEVYAFDLEGRLLTAWLNDQTYVRTLDNRVIKKWRPRHHPSPWKQIRELDAEERRQFLCQCWERVHTIYQLIHHGQASLHHREGVNGQVGEEVSRRLARIIDWDSQRLEEERDKFSSVYTPVSILPPDQYFALVLQATEGCHWNRCTFCHFYRHSRFRIKSEQEFSRHIDAVKEFFGQAIKLRRSVFLGDANALVIPQRQLLRIFDRVNQALPVVPSGPRPMDDEGHVFRGIYSFIDAFSGHKKSEADFRELRARNLQRVYLGVETGCDELLGFLNKPATAGQTLELTQAVKRAGLQVGVIILIGAGGQDYSRSHIKHTIELVNAMKLEPGDIVYFSPLQASPASDYARRAAEAKVRPLSDQEQREQLEAIRSGLRFTGNQRPKISLYDIREFVY